MPCAAIHPQLRSLERLINGVVCSHPGKIHYFQGLHDVAAVLMLTAGERAANPMVERLLHAHLRDCVQVRARLCVCLPVG